MAFPQVNWWSYPRIDNFGQIDPQGNYWKPDSNILTPPGYPVTALLSGTVTSVQRTTWGQTVVTVRLDQQLNDLATHTFYEHMHDATVSPGQHLNAGDLLGHANYAGEGANLGFGLYSGDVYGSGSAWQALQNDLKPGGAGKLNPVGLLNSAKAGANNLALYLAAVGVSASPGPKPNLGPCAFTPSDNPAVYAMQVVQNSLCNLQQQLMQQMVSWGEHIAIFVIAIVLIIVGFFLLAEKQAMQVVQKAGKLVAIS